jgi:hypothetical protein
MNSIADSSGDGFDGTPFNGPVYQSNVPANPVPLTGMPDNTSLQFNGRSQRIFIPDDQLFRLTHSLTLEAYINLSTFQSGSSQDIIFRGDDRVALDPYRLDVINSQLRFQVTNANNQSAWVTAPLPGINQWIHVAGSLDDATGVIAVYVNGKLTASKQTSIRPFALLDPTANPGLGIGNVQSATYAEYFNGLIDEVRISDEALSPSQFLDYPATSLRIDAPSTMTAGSPFDVTVTALNSSGNVGSTYTGTIHFTSSDPQAALPADYTFTAADNGAHTFSNEVILDTPGTQTVTATDTASSITGSATITVSLPVPPIDHFTLSTPGAIVAGNPFDVTVTAFDTQSQIATAYTGTVAFTSSDPYPGVVPATYTFTAGDQGVHTFTGDVTLFTAGSQTLTVQDTTHSTVTGSATIAVSPASASGFLVTAPSPAIAGTAFSVTVTALDPYGNVATGYTGTVILTSSDRTPQPSDYTFTANDNGTHVLTLSLFTAGVQTILTRDASNGFLTGTTPVAVQAASPFNFLVTAPSSAVSGTPFDVIVTVLDMYGNTATDYTGTVHFTTSDLDPGVVLPSNYTFTTGNGGDNGVHDFPAGFMLITSGLQNLSASDNGNGLIGGTQVVVESSPPPPPPGGGGARPPGPSLTPDPVPVGSARPALQAPRWIGSSARFTSRARCLQQPCLSTRGRAKETVGCQPFSIPISPASGFDDGVAQLRN